MSFMSSHKARSRIEDCSISMWQRLFPLSSPIRGELSPSMNNRKSIERAIDTRVPSFSNSRQ